MLKLTIAAPGASRRTIEGGSAAGETGTGGGTFGSGQAGELVLAGGRPGADPRTLSTGAVESANSAGPAPTTG